MRLKIGNKEFLVQSRIPSKGKPAKFLLEIQPDGKRKYISSLYPLNQTAEQYRYETGGVWYVLDIENQSIGTYQK
jgi:hypothetical protein